MQKQEVNSLEFSKLKKARLTELKDEIYYLGIIQNSYSPVYDDKEAFELLCKHLSEAISIIGDLDV